MATRDWPYNLCQVIRNDYGTDREANVRRTEMQDGYIEQKRINTKPLRLREFRVDVKESNLASFESWIDDNSHTWFNFRDLDGETRDCRVRDGKVALQQAADRWDGERYFTGTVILEGY